MIAFVAWTPLHLINVLNVYTNYYPRVEADLYIYDEFTDAHVYYNKLLATGLFKNTILINHNDIPNGISKFINILFNKDTFTDHRRFEYEELFVHGGNYFSKVLFSNNLKLNPALKLNYIEDGIAPYLNGRIFSTSRINRLVYNFFNKYSMLKQEIDKYYVYEPNLVNFPNQKTLKIPKIERCNPAYKYILEVFDDDQEIENVILFIDQPLNDDGYGINEVELAKKISDANKTKKKIVIKKHPRSKIVYEGFETLKSNSPFEIIALQGQFENSVIISPASTIAFSSYMMFGIDFETILLSQLILNEYDGYDKKHREIFKAISSFTNRFNSVTAKQIFLPNNYAELEEKLGELKHNE